MLSSEVRFGEISEIILDLKQQVERLREISGGMQCIDRNCDRMLASVRMMELNITDVLDLVKD